MKANSHKDKHISNLVLALSMPWWLDASCVLKLSEVTEDLLDCHQFPGIDQLLHDGEFDDQPVGKPSKVEGRRDRAWVDHP